MDREELIELVTTEDVVEILRDLGSEEHKKDNKGNLYFSTVCHGGDSHKLYYFIDSKFFLCFTCCGSMSLYDVIMSAKGITFSEAYQYICDFKGISRFENKKRKGLQKTEVKNKDLDFLKLHLYKKEKQAIKLPSYNDYILNVFDNYFPLSWYEEGINDEIADLFKIRFYMNQNKAIIPHYDINGSLVGIRGRSFSKYDVGNGRKYMPVSIEGLTYRYPIQYNLYGIFQNQGNISKFKKAILFESEKSVMLYGSYFGQENNITLALCGMNLSLYQRDLLLSLDINEVIIALDRQYDLNDLKNKEFENYRKTILKIVRTFSNYTTVSAILDFGGLLEYKDSPIDQGKEIFNVLYKNKYDSAEIEEEWGE